MTNSWPQVPLGELLTKSEEWVDINPTDTYREITVRLWGKGVTLRREAVGSEIASSRRLVARAGQFILSRIDARNGAFGLIPDSLDGTVVSNDFPVFTPNAFRLTPAFLNWMSKTRSFVEICKAASEGTTNRVRLQEERFLKMTIPLPPLSEQQRIVARIESLAASTYDARRIRQEAMKEAESIVKAALYGLASTLRVDGKLGDVLAEPPRNGWSARCDNADGGIPVLSLKAITGFEFRSTEFKRTSLYAPKDGHFWLTLGDILLSRSNTPELVGHAAIYNGNPRPCIYPDLMMRLKLKDFQVEPRFVWYWLQSPPAREFIAKSAKGTSPTMKKISQNTVMGIPFPSPLRFAEQRRIVAELDALRTRMEALKKLQADTAAELDALLPSILDKAFKGEL